MHFHVHIYFTADQLEKAILLAEQARMSKLFKFVKLSEQPIGPHPTGMIETHFSEPLYASVLEWLEKNREEFSALIHEDTGDDIKDHTTGSRWLGAKVPIDFGFFDIVQQRPDLRIHK